MKFSLVLLLMTMGAVASAEPYDSLAEVRALYESASYEEALARLSTVDPTAPPARVEQYRAFCLIALGRLPEATAAVERAVEADPELVPAPAEASPRVRAFFAEARQKLLPAVIKRTYAKAKAAYTGKDLETARTEFARVIALADSLGSDAGTETTDLRLVSLEFLDLSNRRAAAAAPANPAPVVTAATVISGEIRQAVAIRQDMPRWSRAALTAPLTGELRVQIDESGAVTSAVIVRSSEPTYDRQVIAAARGWRYKPAERNGKPLASEKTITFVLNSPAR